MLGDRPNEAFFGSVTAGHYDYGHPKPKTLAIEVAGVMEVFLNQRRWQACPSPLRLLDIHLSKPGLELDKRFTFSIQS